MEANTRKPIINQKRTLLQQLRSARSAQLQWRTYALALAQGASVGQAAAQAQARSRFNCWYWSASKQLASLKTFESISVTHKSMLQIDHHISSLIRSDPAPSSFMKWFRSPKSYKYNQTVIVNRLVPKLIENSNRLLKDIEALEKEITRMSEKQLKSLPRTAITKTTSKFRLIRNLQSCFY